MAFGTRMVLHIETSDSLMDSSGRTGEETLAVSTLQKKKDSATLIWEFP
jgi:hypothetical protein